MNTNSTAKPTLIPTGDATALLPLPGDKGKPITVIGTAGIRDGFDATCLQQALNARAAPGVTDLVLNPDAHAGYGAPIGCVLVSPSHIYPGPVGVDIKCSMSLLQLDLPADDIQDRRVRRALIDAIGERIPTGAGRGQRSVPKSQPVGPELGCQVAVEGASAGPALGVSADDAGAAGFSRFAGRGVHERLDQRRGQLPDRHPAGR